MKKMYYIIYICLVCLTIFSFLILMRTNVDNSKVIISHNYSYIIFEGKTYVPIPLELLPENIGFNDTSNLIKATVMDENYFLDKFFFTNYISLTKYNGLTFLHLITDYDINESDYYCLPEFKNSLQ